MHCSFLLSILPVLSDIYSFFSLGVKDWRTKVDDYINEIKLLEGKNINYPENVLSKMESFSEHIAKIEQNSEQEHANDYRHLDLVNGIDLLDPVHS